MSEPKVEKAADIVSDLVNAVGVKEAWNAVANADAATLDDSRKGEARREIALLQLRRAGEMVKQGGITPEVVELLRMMIDLMAQTVGSAGEGDAPAEAPAPASPEVAAADQAKESDNPLDKLTGSAETAKADGPWWRSGDIGRPVKDNPLMARRRPRYVR